MSNNDSILNQKLTLCRILMSQTFLFSVQPKSAENLDAKREDLDAQDLTRKPDLNAHRVTDKKNRIVCNTSRFLTMLSPCKIVCNNTRGEI
jgi:hypothetical protein